MDIGTFAADQDLGHLAPPMHPLLALNRSER